MSKNKSKELKLYAEDLNLKTLLMDLKKNSKMYLRLLEFLNCNGHFEEKVIISLYDQYSDKNHTYKRVWVSDVEENIFIFTIATNNISDFNKIEKITNENQYMYDLSLAKKFLLSEENIELTRSESIHNFKFGRFVTDNKSFYNIFLSNDVCFQIIIKGSEEEAAVNGDEILTELNKFTTIPSLLEYSSIFEKQVSKNNICFEYIEISAYKEFEKVNSLKINGSKQVSENQCLLLAPENNKQ